MHDDWTTRAVACAACAVALSMTVASPAREATPKEWPLDRIIENLEQRLSVSSDDVQAQYNLGRAHAFAFALKRSTLRVYPGLTFGIADLDKQTQKQTTKEAQDPSLQVPPPTADELLVHLSQGVKHLGLACELNPNEARHHLTLAWLLETGAPSGDRVDTSALFHLKRDSLSAEQRGAFAQLIADLGSDDDTRAEAARTKLLSPENLEVAVPLLTQDASTSPQRREAAAGLVQRYWTERAIAEYWVTLNLAMSKDLSKEGVSLKRGTELTDMVSYEALEAYRRLVEERGVRASEVKNLSEAEEKWKQIEAKPRSTWMTPMLVTLDDCRSLDELITPNLTVPFDLDGDGIDELWPWIAPSAGWLVWDPKHHGEITSGQQLFGSASAWLFFEDGYRVLDALDDDRDGELRGAELAGISVWFDRDTDGVSDRGEVVPVEELGIAALRTQATLKIGDSPANPCGIEMRDGRVLPSYDWVLEPVSE